MHDAAGQAVSAFIMISIFGALGGLVMTAPRIIYAPASQYKDDELVPLQLMNVATRAAVFRLRKRSMENRHNDQYLTPCYPVVPLVFIVVMTLLMVNAAVYNPLDTFIGARADRARTTRLSLDRERECRVTEQVIDGDELRDGAGVGEAFLGPEHGITDTSVVSVHELFQKDQEL